MAFFHGMLLLCLSILCIGGYAIFIEPDQSKLRDAEGKLAEKKTVETQLKKDIQATQAQIDKLKTPTTDGALAVEHVAREKLGYCRETEEIYIFNNDEKPKVAPAIPAKPIQR
jgi:cell division protein FtsB